MGLFETLKSFFLGIWDQLKKIAIKIINFFRDLISWFKVRYLNVIENHPNAEAIVLKIEDRLNTKDYVTLDVGLKKGAAVKTFYDRDTREIILDQTEVVEYEDLDAETKSRFGSQDMLVLK